MDTQLSALPVSEWSEIKPGGLTKCARGTDAGAYAFYVRRPDSSAVSAAATDLLLDFEGGGSCWGTLHSTPPALLRTVLLSD